VSSRTDPAKSWPALSYETLPWESRYELGAASRNQLRLHRGPYSAAVVPDIARRAIVLGSDALAQAEDASNEVARFDIEMGGEIAPFAAVLLRSESAASSQIENLTASARAIAEAEIGATGRQNAARIVANTRAMEAAVALADRLDSDSIQLMHQALMGVSDPDIAGKWREDQVWIGGSDLGPHGASFVPPHHSRVGAAIDDLVAFMARDDVPVLVQAAIAHAQFETVHPFPDGNGRVGRALLHSMLRNKGLTRNVTLPISAGLLADTDSYFDALTAYRAGDPTALIGRVSEASFTAIANGRRLAEDLRDIRSSWADRIKSRRNSATWRAADLLIRHPVVNAKVLTEELQVAPTNVYRYIGPLMEAGVLVEFTQKGRDRAWRCDEVLAALDAFASRAGKRRLPGRS
jgi:Fic family protein